LIRQILPCYHRAAAEVWGKLPLKRARQLVAELVNVSVNAERIAAGVSTRPK
jgi:hypothetical protein